MWSLLQKKKISDKIFKTTTVGWILICPQGCKSGTGKEKRGCWTLGGTAERLYPGGSQHISGNGWDNPSEGFQWIQDGNILLSKLLLELGLRVGLCLSSGTLVLGKGVRPRCYQHFAELFLHRQSLVSLI